MDTQAANNCTLYLMLIVCLILVTVDSIEMYRLSLSWEYSLKVQTEMFNECLKNDLIIKTVFCVFSLAAAVSALLLTLFLSFFAEFFINKVMTSYLYLNYYIFGPYMLAFCILGCAYWNDFVYVCDRRDYHIKVFSISNVFSLITCLIIGIVVTLGVAAYEGLRTLIDSILHKDDGLAVVRKVFWWLVLRQRTDQDLSIITSRQYIQERMNI
jgi:hypothetical protein